MLGIDVRELRGGSVRTDGSIEADDPALEGLGVAMTGPVEVDGELRLTNASNYHWRGHITARVQGTCRRCLTDVTQLIDDDVDAILSADPDLADDPSVYPLPARVAQVDVRPVVREELGLHIAAFPLCRDDCRGLCATCGADLNAGACACAAGTTH